MWRTRRRFVVLAVLPLGFATWWHFPSATRFNIEDSVADVLEHASTWELLSITGVHPPELEAKLDAIERGDPMPEELFRWHSVLEGAIVDENATRRTLTRAFNRARRGWRGWHVMCFNPRHVIRASLPTGEGVELLICFECQQYKAYPTGSETCIAQGNISDRQREVFDSVYRSFGLKIAPRSCD